jgi:hypothetical protein
MADYQYTPDPNDIVPKLVDALMNADGGSPSASAPDLTIYLPFLPRYHPTLPTQLSRFWISDSHPSTRRTTSQSKLPLLLCATRTSPSSSRYRPSTARTMPRLWQAGRERRIKPAIPLRPLVPIRRTWGTRRVGRRRRPRRRRRRGSGRIKI